MKSVPKFPITVWDGRAGNRNPPLENSSPEYRDWDQLLAEIIAIEQYLLDNPGGGSASGDSLVIEATASESLVAGSPCIVSGNGIISSAQADSIITSQVIGLTKETILSSGIGDIVLSGKIEIADWTAITGSSELIPGNIYYLDSNSPAMLTETATVTVGDCVVRIGIALTTTILIVNIDAPILL